MQSLQIFGSEIRYPVVRCLLTRVQENVEGEVYRLVMPFGCVVSCQRRTDCAIPKLAKLQKDRSTALLQYRVERKERTVSKVSLLLPAEFGGHNSILAC